MERIIPAGFYARARSRVVSRRLAAEFFSVLPFVLATTSVADPGGACAKFSRSEIKKRVEKIVIEHLGVNESQVVDSAQLVKDLGADSLDKVELVMTFEEQFGCEIDDIAAEKIVTVKDAIDFLASCEAWPPPGRTCADIGLPSR